jgi:hypothetical protein
VLSNQFVIQAILIAAFFIFAIVLVLPGRGARRLAVRRLALLLAFFAAVVAVAFPTLINDLANLLGVGRGTDLILYVLVVVFVGNSIASAAQNRQLHREITHLARVIALRDAKPPRHPE